MLNLKKIRKINSQTNSPEEQFKIGYRFINLKTITQRDSFYESYVSWNRNSIKREIKAIKWTLKEAESNPEVLGRWNTSETLLSKISSLEEQDKNKPYIVKSLEWLKQAEIDFDKKLKKVAEKLVEFNFCKLRVEMNVLDVSQNHSRGLDFYITAEETIYSETEEQFGSPKRIITQIGRAHARMIWVECTEKESHWRFICTLKK
jgi:hypothetical protein